MNGLKKGKNMASKTIKILLAYAAGQATQLVIHAMCLSNNMYNYRQIPFCIAGGFVILFAVISGVWIASSRGDGENAAEKKSYLDWAKIPGEEEEVLNPFADKK